jgi:putative ABC transport system permease protein
MRTALRFYRALLRLYPTGFRLEYRHELVAAFTDRVRDYAGPFAAARGVAAAIGDVLPNAAAAHWEILRQDTRYGIRSLARTPGFAITAVLVVALGVGANVAAFSLADFVLLKPLPFPEPDRLVAVWQSTPGYSRMEFSPANYRDLGPMTRSFDGLGAHTGRPANLTGAGEPRRLALSMVTPEVMPVLRVPALIGRTITPEDSTDERVMVLSFGLWQTQFGADPGVVGTMVRLDDAPVTIIGVMPQTFVFPFQDVQGWMPLVLRERHFESRADNYLEVVGRLRPGVTIDRANSDVAAAATELERRHPKENEATKGLVVDLRDRVSARARLLVLALCGAAACILLLACANLASLLLTRATHRRRELAVRSALGAGRERLVRQLVTESVGLSTIGGIAGIAIAALGLPLLATLIPAGLPTAERPSIDLRVLAAAAVLAIVTGLAFGVGPAIAAGRGKALDALRDGARGGARTQRTRAILVIVEVAASVVLLVGSGLLIRAVLRIQSTNPGFRAEHLLTVQTELLAQRYAVAAFREPLYRRILDDVRALPGVEGAAYATSVPMSMRGGIWPVALFGEPVIRAQSNSASLRSVTPAYFETMGIPLIAGRDVAVTDTRDVPNVAVISQSLARRHWPNDDPLGKRFRFAFAERTVVGVVGNVLVRGLERESEPQVYVPSTQLPDSMLSGYQPKALVIRSSVPPATLLPAVRRIIAAADPALPVSEVRAMTEIIANETAPRLTQVRVLGVLSVIALLIAGVGIHGLLAFAVSHRSRELGVRRALGEQAGSILRRVLREGLALAAVGVTIGVLVAYLAARGMGALLAGVQPGDPVTLVAAAALCFVTAVAGCLRPALRAARVDPITVLRGD